MENKHVAVFAFPFGSHLIPLLNLVTKLAQAAPDTCFSFIGTEKSNAILFPKPHLPSNIKAYAISDGMPEAHVLGPNPTEKLSLFLQTGPQNLHRGIELAVADTKRRVTCIIADSFVTSSLLVAQTLHVPWIAFWTPISSSLSLYFYVHSIRHACQTRAQDATLEFLPGLSKLRVGDVPRDLLDVGEKETVFTRSLNSLGEVLPHAEAVVMNFFAELDPPAFVEDMRSKLKSFLYVVPFLCPLLSAPETDSSGCLSWLDAQSSKSVAYVCFGTVVAPPRNEIVAVAEALEESGFPFLWALKEGLVKDLPNGFVERTKTRGKVVSWAPQAQVLAHDSVGVFVTHCGCNSVTESVSSGVPMICRPFFGDQEVGGRVIEDVWEIGVVIEGNVFTKNGLLKSLNLILKDEEGKKIRENAVKVKKTVQGASGPQGQGAQDFNKLVEVISGKS